MIIQILLFSIVCEILSLPDPHRGGISEINHCLESCNVCEIENPAGMVETAKIGGGSVSGHYHEARFIVNAHDVFRFNHHGAFPILTVKNCGFLPLISRHFKKSRHNVQYSGRWPVALQYKSANRKPVCWGLPQIFAINVDPYTNVSVRKSQSSCRNADLNPGPNLVFKSGLSNLVSLLGGVEGSPNQGHTNGTQTHSYDRSSAHNESPQGGLLLRNKVLLITLICAVFVGLLCRAFIRLSEGDDAAGFPYLLLGVFGVMASFIIGPALIFGGF